MSEFQIKSVPFFNSKETVFAIDNSGSTSGEILRRTKQLIISICEQLANKDEYLNHILAWNSSCSEELLDNIDSDGGTDPTTIFKEINSNIKNLFITTDGLIDKNLVDDCRGILKSHSHIKNIISVLIINDDNLRNLTDLNISVFYPFREHAMKMGGNFYMFCSTSNKIYLLMKKIHINFIKFDKIPNINGYKENMNWKDFPEILADQIANIMISDNYYNYNELDEGEIYFPYNRNYKILIKPLCEKLKKDDKILYNKPLDEFLRKNGYNLVDECFIIGKFNNYNYLRNINSSWRTTHINILREEKRSESEINEFIKENKKLENIIDINQSSNEINDFSFKNIAKLEKDFEQDEEIKRKIENSICLEYYSDRYGNVTIFGYYFYQNNYQNIEIIIDNKIINSRYYNFEREGIHNIYIYIKREITNFYDMFNGSSLNSLKGLEKLDTSKGQNFGYFLANCYKIIDLSPIESWDMSNCYNFSHFFHNCSSLSNIQPLGKWDVGNGKNFRSVFNKCTSLVDISPLRNWNVGKGEIFYYMFSDCMITDFSPISNWDIKNGKDFGGMFARCSGEENCKVLEHWKKINSNYDPFYCFIF